MQQFLLRYGEIGTKSMNIRRNFVDILIQNIERTFLKYKREVFIERERGRIYAFVNKNDAYLFSRIFGIVSYSPVTETSSELDSIKKESRKFAADLSGTFAVRARRTGEHDYTSPQAAGEIGSVVLEENLELEVDLDSPEHELYLEIRNDRAYIFNRIYEGPGGLPLSSQGKVASYIQNRNDFLATWLLMKRGARAYVYHASDTDWMDRLDKWDPKLKILGVGDKKDFLKYDLPDEINGIVLGDTLETLEMVNHGLPIFRPLIAFTGNRINAHLDKIQTLEKKDF